MTRGEDFIKRGKCVKNHCSYMSNSAWTDLNSKGNILNFMTNVQTLNVVVRKLLPSHHINICLRVDR